MKVTDNHHVDIARITIELTSPMHIGTGESDDLVDQFFATDLNGLPTIPATSIAGVLRALWKASQKGSSQTSQWVDVQKLFGYQHEGKQSNADANTEGEGSALIISWGHLHDSNDRPVSFRMTPAELQKDELLRLAQSAVTRQHVRINHKGTAAPSSLFDENIVVAGHRFTFELALYGQEAKTMEHLIYLLQRHDTRFGGKSRNGLGAFKVQKCLRYRFNLADKKDFERYTKLPSDLSAELPKGILEELPLDKLKQQEDAQGDVVSVKIKLRPRGFWLIGGGTPTEEDEEKAKKEEQLPDIMPYREIRVQWQNGRGSIDTRKPPLVFPGTAFKGSLRHRVRYYSFIEEGTFADEQKPDFFSQLAEEKLKESSLEELFGTVRDATKEELEEDNSTLPPKAGRLIFSDLVIDKEPPSKKLEHVSLDRFTAGPLDGHLFQEQALWQAGPMGYFEFQIDITEASQLFKKKRAKKAFFYALDDLVNGYLQMGSGSGRGHGWFEGIGANALRWSDPEWAKSYEMTTKGGNS